MSEPLRSFFLGLSGWDWADLIGLAMVFFGVLGTVIMLFVRAPKFPINQHGLLPTDFRKEEWESRLAAFESGAHTWEIICEGVLIVGLGLELAALPHHFKEAGELREIAGEANERAAKADRIAEELRKENLRLYEQIQPRRITQQQENRILAVLGRFPKLGKISIEQEPYDWEAEVYARRILEVLKKGGFEPTIIPPNVIRPPSRFLKNWAFSISFLRFGI